MIKKNMGRKRREKVELWDVRETPGKVSIGTTDQTDLHHTQSKSHNVITEIHTQTQALPCSKTFCCHGNWLGGR